MLVCGWYIFILIDVESIIAGCLYYQLALRPSTCAPASQCGEGHGIHMSTQPSAHPPHWSTLSIVYTQNSHLIGLGDCFHYPRNCHWLSSSEIYVRIMSLSPQMLGATHPNYFRGQFIEALKHIFLSMGALTSICWFGGDGGGTLT